MDIVFDEESGMWDLKKEPYAIIEVATEDNMRLIEIAIAKQKP